jgi:tight adherence protein B
MSGPLAMTLGAGFGLGLYLFVTGVQGRSVVPRWPPSRTRRQSAFDSRTGGIALAVAVAAWLATGWPAAGVVGVVATLVVPRLLSDRQQKAYLAKTEAIASWTEMLRDSMRAADGVEGAISATVGIAPPPIRQEVTVLAARASAISLTGALAEFGRALDHPEGDLVVAALSSAAEGEGSNFTGVLDRLAAMTRDTVRMRLRVEASRASVRTSSRLVLAIAVVGVTLLAVFNRGYLESYGDPLGQAWLVGVAGLFGASVALMERMRRLKLPERFAPRQAAPRHTRGAWE